MTVQWLSLLASPGDTNEFIIDEKAPFISSDIILDGGEIAWSEASQLSGIIAEHEKSLS